MPLTDSTLIITAPDTAACTLKHLPGADTLTCAEKDAPWSAYEQSVTYSGHVPFASGLQPEPRNELPGYNSGVMTVLIAVFLFIAFNFRHYTTFLKTFTQNLFSVRQRANAFDDKNTMSETRILLSLILLLCVCEGILIFSAVRLHGIFTENFMGMGLMTLLAGAYYIFQLIAYRTVGYVFTTPRRADMWLKGFNASQSLLGITLAAPAVLALFNPGSVAVLLSVSVILYAIARIIFIYKGFRIFYNNSFSLVYFILYLCSLEIIPIIIIYKASIIISKTATY